MIVEQYVMAYGADQDRIRAILPEGFESLRPVLRINAEVRGTCGYYLEFNVPVEADGKRGWLNIANWSSGCGDKNDCNLEMHRDGRNVTFRAPFIEITFSPVGIQGGCPAEKDNDGCFYLGSACGKEAEFRPAEVINEKKEFCDCSFRWMFNECDAAGKSTGETIPAYCRDVKNTYEKLPFTAENAAAIPCEKVLGSYIVVLERVGL